MSNDEGVYKERLHKFLASTGAGSRRECEKLIEQGRVSVNGQLVSKMGIQVDPTSDKVRLDGELVKAEEKVYWILNKPSGTICTNSDERGRPRVVDLVPDRKHRLYTVGRLDADSRGLIMLTNDGTIANIICHPRYRLEKIYQVAVRGKVAREQITKVEAGVWLSEGRSSPAKVKALGYNARRDETLIEMTIFEGRNREVRRVLARVGLNVRRLQRVRIGPLELGELPPGGSRRLHPSELKFVKEAETLYMANKEVWDAELPKVKPRMAPGRGPRGGVKGRGKRGPATDVDDQRGAPKRGPGAPRGTGEGTAPGPDDSRPERRRRFYD